MHLPPDLPSSSSSARSSGRSTPTTGVDVGRQAVVVLAAVFQVAAGPIGASVHGRSIGAVSDANDTSIVPAGYTFSIWGVIFALCVVYAGYQALPSHRDDSVLRRVGWLAATAFTGNGIWSLLFPGQLFVLSQVVLMATLASAVAAFVLSLRDPAPRPSPGSGSGALTAWAVSLPLGLLAGWVTAATVVGFAATGSGTGLVDAGTGEDVLGSMLLLIGGAVAAGVLWLTQTPTGTSWLPGPLAYTTAVLWGLVGIVVNQHDTSRLTTTAALVAGVLVVLAAGLAVSRARRRQAR